MKAIEILANGQIITFTGKSLIMDGKEYLYTNMSEIKRSSKNHVYFFKYDGDFKAVRYNEADANKLNALFARIAKLNANRAAAAKAKAEQAEAIRLHTIAGVPGLKEQIQAAAREAEAKKLAEAQGTSAVTADEVTGASEVKATPDKVLTSDPVSVPIPKEITQPAKAEAKAPGSIWAAVEQAKAEDEAPKAEEVPAIPTPVEETKVEEAKVEDAAATTEAAPEENAEAKAETPAEVKTDDADEDEELPADPERSSKLKKSLLIFLAILVVFAGLGVAWWFTLGPASNPSAGPDANGNQHYNDIDELIQELE